MLRPRGPGWNGTRHAGRSRGVPGLRPPTECSGLAAPGGMGRDMLDGAGASLVSGHPRSAPASRYSLQYPEQLLVRLAEADRDPEVAGEADVGAVPHEEARVEELVPEGRRVGDLDGEDVRLARTARIAAPRPPHPDETATPRD